jgi:hypothetical protein
MIAELALLMTLGAPTRSPGPVLTTPTPTPVATAATAAAPTECDRDCVWVISLHNFRCVVGTKGYDCVDYSNGCGMMDCGGSFLVDAGGALRQFATCEQNVRNARANAVETGTAPQFDDAVRSGLITVARNTLKQLRQ